MLVTTDALRISPFSPLLKNIFSSLSKRKGLASLCFAQPVNFSGCLVLIFLFLCLFGFVLMEVKAGFKKCGRTEEYATKGR